MNSFKQTIVESGITDQELARLVNKYNIGFIGYIKKLLGITKPDTYDNIKCLYEASLKELKHRRSTDWQDYLRWYK